MAKQKKSPSHLVRQLTNNFFLFLNHYFIFKDALLCILWPSSNFQNNENVGYTLYMRFVFGR